MIEREMGRGMVLKGGVRGKRLMQGRGNKGRWGYGVGCVGCVG